jgi:hypothetical protein
MVRIAPTRRAWSERGSGASIAAISSCDARSIGANALRPAFVSVSSSRRGVVARGHFAQIPLPDEPAQDAA